MEITRSDCAFGRHLHRQPAPVPGICAGFLRTARTIRAALTACTTVTVSGSEIRRPALQTVGGGGWIMPPSAITHTRAISKRRRNRSITGIGAVTSAVLPGHMSEQTGRRSSSIGPPESLGPDDDHMP